MKVVSIIPARGGSKGIPRKNMIDLNGNPLISYTINASLKSNVDETWVNSEDVEILSFSKKCGAKTFLRPQELATDESSSESVLLHFAQNIEFDILVFIQATSPLLKPRHINKGIELMKDYDSVTSVYKETWVAKFDSKGKPIGWRINKRPRRQDADTIFVENGALFVTTKENLLRSRMRYSGEIGFVKMPFSESFDINSYDDLNLIKKLL